MNKANHVFQKVKKIKKKYLVLICVHSTFFSKAWRHFGLIDAYLYIYVHMGVNACFIQSIYTYTHTHMDHDIIPQLRMILTF